MVSMDAGEELEQRMRTNRTRDRLERARHLRDVPPEETVEAAFDLANFLQKVRQVGG